MTQLPEWVAWTVAVGSPLLTFAGVAWAARLNRQGVKRSDEQTQRADTMRMLRWAAELTGSNDSERVRLGVAQLDALSSSDLLGANGHIFVEAALEAALSDLLHEIEKAGVSLDEVRVVLEDEPVTDAHEATSVSIGGDEHE